MTKRREKFTGLEYPRMADSLSSLNVLVENVGSIGMLLRMRFGRYQSSSSLKERDI